MLVNLQEWAPVNEAREFGQRLNQIKNILTADCEDDWVVAAELAAPALGSAVKMLLTPSAGEILENYLEPGGGGGKGRIGRSQRTGRRRDRNGRYHGAWRNLIPDVDAMIAAWLPGRNMFASRTPGMAQKLFWSGINVSDRVLWYLMLAELADEFTMQWCSNLMQARFCGNPMSAVMSWFQTPFESHGTTLWAKQVPTSRTNAFGWNFEGYGFIDVPEGKYFTGVMGVRAYGTCISQVDNIEGQVYLQCNAARVGMPQYEFSSPAVQMQFGTKGAWSIEEQVDHVTRIRYYMAFPNHGITQLPIDSMTAFGYCLGELHDIPK